jgi:hypothetical protein
LIGFDQQTERAGFHPAGWAGIACEAVEEVDGHIDSVA